MKGGEPMRKIVLAMVLAALTVLAMVGTAVADPKPGFGTESIVISK